jgi:hypothetical protein
MKPAFMAYINCTIPNGSSNDVEDSSHIYVVTT